ncbi:MAG TPA: cytidylate kinase family protein, partial [Kiritimatiellia bacterium]
MKTPADAVASYIDAEVRDFAHRRAEESRPFVTISRQTGAGGITVGRLLSAYLQTQGIAAGDGTPWKVFDRDLIAEVLRACDLPARVEPYMTESKTSEFNDSLEEMFGLHPAKWLLVKKTSETILHLAGLGHVILVGRGANVVTAKLDGGFHVRLVGSFARRVEHLMAYDDLG